MKKKLLIILLFISLLLLVFIGGNLIIDSNTKSEEFEAVMEESEAIEAEEEAAAEEEEIIEEEVEESKYHFTDMDETKYCTSSNINVRNEPSKDGEEVGKLGFNEPVHILGQCNETEWYKIEFEEAEDKIAYVSDEFIGDEVQRAALKIPSDITIPESTKEILFIGNSITMHGPADFWWGDNWGMGATTKANDYVHRTASAMGYERYDVMSMRNWELTSNRNKHLSVLDTYITRYQYNIIVIELGENAKGHEPFFEEDLLDMITYIKAYNPNAKIVMMDNFWKYPDIIQMKKNVAGQVGATYVSLSDCWGVKEYQLQAGETITLEDGRSYVVDSFVAGHPNNAGFEAMANHLIPVLQGM